MSYQQPYGWAPPPKPQNNPALIILGILGGMCVLCMVGSFFRGVYIGATRARGVDAGTPITAPALPVVALVPSPARPPLPPLPPTPPDDSAMQPFADNDHGRVPAADRERVTALGNVEAPMPLGWSLDESIAPTVRRGLMNHCSGRGRRRACPEWFILTELSHMEVIRGPGGELSARVATMIPTQARDSVERARNICVATRYELFRASGNASATVFVYRWDGLTVAAASQLGQACE